MTPVVPIDADLCVIPQVNRLVGETAVVTFQAGRLAVDRFPCVGLFADVGFIIFIISLVRRLRISCRQRKGKILFQRSFVLSQMRRMKKCSCDNRKPEDDQNNHDFVNGLAAHVCQ